VRIIFAGTPEFSVAPLVALKEAGFDLCAVYTQPDRPAGRGRKLTPPPVKAKALEFGIPVYQPLNFKSEEAIETLKSHQADVMVVVAYGLILPKVILDAPKYGCLNIHASLLPRWRGAAPLQRAIESGDSHSGVTIMQMDIGLDTGDMLYTLDTAITPQDTTQSLHDRLSAQGSEAIVTVLKNLSHFQAQAQKQDESQVTYAHKISKEEGEINWAQPASLLLRKIHAFNPWPICYTQRQGESLRIWQGEVLDEQTTGQAGQILAQTKEGLDIQTGQGRLRITQIQPPGKKAMPVADFLNGLNGHSLVGEIWPSPAQDA
jgi:methionyl-tRNA formyltransferase